MSVKNYSSIVDLEKIGIPEINSKIAKNTSDIAALETNALPEVNSSDNGKILGVENGEWDKIDAPSSIDVIANPETGEVVGELFTIKIGKNNYKVNERPDKLKNVQKVKMTLLSNVGDDNIGMSYVQFVNERTNTPFVYPNDATITASVPLVAGYLTDIISNTPRITENYFAASNIPIDIVIDFGENGIDLSEYNMFRIVGVPYYIGVEVTNMGLYSKQFDNDSYDTINSSISFTWVNPAETHEYTMTEVDVRFFTKTLSSGSTSLTFHSKLFGSNLPIIVMDKSSGIYAPTTLSFTAALNNNDLTLTFTAQASDVDIAVYIPIL